MLNNGIKILSHNEQVIANHAEKRIEQLKALKESFFSLMSEARKHTTVSQFAYEDAVIAMEESFDELLYSDFADAVEASGSLEELPKSRFYRNWLNRRTTVRCALPAITNPATLSQMGVEV